MPNFGESALPDSIGADQFDPNRFTHAGRNEADKTLLVKFFMKPRQDKAESMAQGRPVFRDVEYIDIKIPGNRNAGACRPANDQDRARFPEHYKAFKDRVSQEINEGTPLTEWPLISRSQAEELAFFHVKTVEQLATMSDAQASKFMGLSSVRAKAKTWLENVEKDKPLWEMDQKLRAQNAEIAELKQSLADVLARVEGGEEDEDLTAAQRKRAKSRAIKAAKEKVS